MLTTEQIQFYETNGYLVAGDIFTPGELDRMEAAYDDILKQRQSKGADVGALWGGNWQKKYPEQKQLLHTHDLQAYSSEWSRVLLHDRFTESIADLMGPNVQLHHTKMFLKPPRFGGAFPMHQDYHYFPHEKDSMMAVVIHLSDSTEEMGCIRVVPGSHKLGVLETFEAKYLNPEEYPAEEATPAVASRGDVLFFSYLTIHGSGMNTSDNIRKTVLIQVRDPADPPLQDVHRSHSQGLMMRGIHPLGNNGTAEATLDDPKREEVKPKV
jgi:hypothetical protein